MYNRLIRKGIWERNVLIDKNMRKLIWRWPDGL